MRFRIVTRALDVAPFTQYYQVIDRMRDNLVVRECVDKNKAEEHAFRMNGLWKRGMEVLAMQHLRRLEAVASAALIATDITTKEGATLFRVLQEVQDFLITTQEKE